MHLKNININVSIINKYLKFLSKSYALAIAQKKNLF